MPPVPPRTRERLEQLVRRTLTSRLGGRRVVWTRRLRVFCDNGQPRFRWIPRWHPIGFDPYWGLGGVTVSWLGREFNVVLGADRNGLYAAQCNPPGRPERA